jgi:hypothetical protein
MGCACLKAKTSHELLVDELFSYLKIKRTKLPEILERVEFYTNKSDIPFIPETNFQVLLNTYLTPDDISYRKHFYSYWCDYFKHKQHKLQQPLIKLNFALLSSCYPMSDGEYFEKIFKDFRMIRGKKENNDVRMSVEDIFFLLKDHIYSISLLCVEHFKHFSQTPLEFEEYLKKIWDKQIIEAFIKKHFFYPDDTWSTLIHLKKFFYDHLEFLNDDNEIRRSLSEFSVSYVKKKREKGEDYSDLFKRNND